MNSIDIVLGILFVYAFYKGFKNGIIIEIASIVALVAGVFCAIYFSDVTASYLLEKFQWSEKYIAISSFVITFLLVLIGVHLLGKVLTKLVKALLLGTVNKILGGIFGLLKMVLILGIVLVYIDRKVNLTQWMSSKQADESLLYTYLFKSGRFLYDFIFDSGIAERLSNIV